MAISIFNVRKEVAREGYLVAVLISLDSVACGTLSFAMFPTKLCISVQECLIRNGGASGPLVLVCKLQANGRAHFFKSSKGEAKRQAAHFHGMSRCL